MQYQSVCLETFTCLLPDEICPSSQIEEQLSSVYEKLHLPMGRLEMMTGIRERRFFPPGSRPGDISAQTAQLALEDANLPLESYGALIHGSVCRDQMEPATANKVHHAIGLPNQSFVLDVSNACLGLLNGMVLLANMIEMGQVQAGIVVGSELGRGLVEATIQSLLNDRNLTRKSMKYAFASLTIGSASAAIVLAHESISRTGHHFLGGAARAETASHQLCAGGIEDSYRSDDRPLMSTDSEALLHAGVKLARETWIGFQHELNWNNEDVHKVITHQVGRAHRQLLLSQLGLEETLDFPTVEHFGNTGAVALPMTASLAMQQRHFQSGDRIALLGIGSGLNSLMLGIDWA